MKTELLINVFLCLNTCHITNEDYLRKCNVYFPVILDFARRTKAYSLFGQILKVSIFVLPQLLEESLRSLARHAINLKHKQTLC